MVVALDGSPRHLPHPQTFANKPKDLSSAFFGGLFWTLFVPFQPFYHFRHLYGDGDDGDGDLVGGWSGACVEDMPEAFVRQ